MSVEPYEYDPNVPEACIIQREDGKIVFVSLNRNAAIRCINNFIKEQKEQGYKWSQVDTSIICLSIPTVYMMFQNEDNPEEKWMLLEFPISK